VITQEQIKPYADLSGADLSNADLSGADLSNADLSNADLSNADLSNADLSNADLRDAILRNANLRDADMRDAILRNADLSNADMRDADLSNGDLSNADLSGADLRDATGNMCEIKSAQFDRWVVTWSADVIAIGCQQHAIKKWRNADPRWIAAMDIDATDWWSRYGSLVIQLIDVSPATGVVLEVEA
jgi:hypothetical protein